MIHARQLPQLGDKTGGFKEKTTCCPIYNKHVYKKMTALVAWMWEDIGTIKSWWDFDIVLQTSHFKVITSTWKAFLSDSDSIVLIATSLPFHLALQTTPKAPRPTTCECTVIKYTHLTAFHYLLETDHHCCTDSNDICQHSLFGKIVMVNIYFMNFTKANHATLETAQ